MLLYIYVKFHENISNDLELQSGHDFVTDRRTGQNKMSPNPTGGDIIMPGIEPGAFHMQSKRFTTEPNPLLSTFGR